MGKHTHKHDFNVTYKTFDVDKGKEVKCNAIFVNISMTGALTCATNKIGADKILAISYLNPLKAQALREGKTYKSAYERIRESMNQPAQTLFP